MKNNNGYLLYMEDIFGNVVNDNYATYEIAFCVLVSRERELSYKSALKKSFIMDNDTGELLFYSKDNSSYADGHGYMVIWQDKGQKRDDYDFVWFKYEENAMDFFHKYEFDNDVNVMVMEMSKEEVISYDEGVYSDYDRIMEWRYLYDC